MYDARTAPIYDLLYDANDSGPLRNSRAEAEHLLGLIRSHHPSAASLLDVGCGTGRHLAALGDAMSVHGVDIHPGFLEVARRRRPSGTFIEADMEELRLDRGFDVITCLFSSIAYASSLDRLERTVAGFVRHLHPGGVVIIEPWFSPDAFWDGHVSSNHVDRPEIKISWMHRQERDERVSRLEIHYLVGTAEGLSHHEECHELGLYTDEEYRAAMEGVGLSVSFDAVGFGRGLYVGTDRRGG